MKKYVYLEYILRDMIVEFAAVKLDTKDLEK